MGRNIISTKLYIVLKTSLRGNRAVIAYAAGWHYKRVATDNVVTQMLMRLSIVEVLHENIEVP